MAFQQLGGNRKFAADGPDFVLIEGRKGFQDAAFVDEFLNAGNSVVMGLDEVGLGAAAGFDGVGVNGSLAENPASVEIMFAFENALLDLHKLLADHVAFLLGVGDACERGEEQLAGVFNKEGA